jgi:hypothetical protein
MKLKLKRKTILTLIWVIHRYIGHSSNYDIFELYRQEIELNEEDFRIAESKIIRIAGHEYQLQYKPYQEIENNTLILHIHLYNITSCELREEQDSIDYLKRAYKETLKELRGK